MRPAWWRELALVGVTYGLYTLTRNTLPAHEARARDNALDLYEVEKRMHLDIEHTVNDFVAGQGAHPLAVVANYTYSLSHFCVTLAVLVWLYVARPRAYRAGRTVLLMTTLLGLLGFWLFPLAPPRFFPHLGFVDTVVRDGTWGTWGSASVASVSNQYAAMPSIHVAWSIWSAVVVAVLARRLWVRVAAALYPVVVLFVVVGTANHWSLDAAGGLAAIALAASVCAVAGRGRYAGRHVSPGGHRGWPDLAMAAGAKSGDAGRSGRRLPP